jgi:transcriptional regulator GlxA family with amidase domain
MPQPGYNVHATAITAYAISWGFLMKLGEKGVLTPVEIIDSLDLALAFVEENAGAFDDRTATDTARQLLESLMRTVGEQRRPPRPSPSDTE